MWFARLPSARESSSAAPRARVRRERSLQVIVSGLASCKTLGSKQKLIQHKPPRAHKCPRHPNMILTTCAACAAPLAHDAPRCVRCKVRYCDSTCQHDHWRRGHKQMCKKIHRGGNAEQYHADKKYKEAVAVAVEACADDTICLARSACRFDRNRIDRRRSPGPGPRQRA